MFPYYLLIVPHTECAFLFHYTRQPNSLLPYTVHPTVFYPHNIPHSLLLTPYVPLLPAPNYASRTSLPYNIFPSLLPHTTQYTYPSPAPHYTSPFPAPHYTPIFPPCVAHRLHSFLSISMQPSLLPHTACTNSHLSLIQFCPKLHSPGLFHIVHSHSFLSHNLYYSLSDMLHTPVSSTILSSFNFLPLTVCLSLLIHGIHPNSFISHTVHP